jgi:hypothetical protein
VTPALALEPRTGAAAAETALTFRGKDLKGAPRVLIGGVEATAVKLTGDVITARAPARGPGVVDVVVELRAPKADSPPTVLSAGTFTYVGTLKLVDVAPAVVSPLGGTVIALTGSGFGPGLRVAVGGVGASEVTVNDDTQATARVPAGTSGPVEVSVRLGPATATLAGKLSYRCPAPDGRALLILVLLAGGLGASLHALRSFYTYVGTRKLVWSWVAMYLLLPLVGATMALLFYLIVGAGLLPLAGTEPGYGVIGVAALVGLFSSQALEKLKRVAEGVFTQVPQNTESLAAPAIVIDDIAPAVGAAGDTVKITGSGFGVDSTVRFGKVHAVSAALIDAKTLAVIVPDSAKPETVDVSVSRPTHASGVKVKAFTYR